MRILIFAVVLLLATSLGIIIQFDPGYALFAYKNWTVEMPLWVLAILFILGFFILSWTFGILSFLFSGKKRAIFWWGNRKRKKAHLDMIQGLLELNEGRFEKAERYLIRSAPYSDAPLINYLKAAEAAEKLGDIERGTEYLKLGLKVSPKSELALRITEAQLAFKQGNFDKSLTILKNLPKKQLKQDSALRLLYHIYEADKDYVSLHQILPDLYRSKVFRNKEELQAIERKIYQNLIPERAKEGSKPLMKFWKKSPSHIQSDPSNVLLYAHHLESQQASNEAESVLRQSLKKSLSSSLVDLYSKLSLNLKKQLNFLESFISKEKMNDPVILLSLGRLSLKNKLWGKARDYLERSVALSPTAEGYALLAELMDQMNLPDKKNEYRKKALELALTSS